MTIDINGPFRPEYVVSVGGYRVPFVSATPLDDGRVSVVVDRRFGMPDPISRDEFDRWMPIIANAMAVAAGYSCHGENCTPINQFKTRISKLVVDTQKPFLTVIEGGPTT